MTEQSATLKEGLYKEPYKICITTFLGKFLQNIGYFYQRKEAKLFIKEAGKDMEIFLPFFKWFDGSHKISSVTVRYFKKMLKKYGMSELRSFHAGYAGQGFLLERFFMNPSDPRSHRENVKRLKRELALIGELKKEFSISRPVIYVIHGGRREKGIGWEESVQACISTIKNVLPAAEKAGVCLSLENVYSHPGEEEIGTTLSSVKYILREIGLEWVEKGVLGWTFDPAHALLTYSGNYDAIERELQDLLPWCVHVHVNHPRTSRNGAGELFSEWNLGDDNHNAPVVIPHRSRYWSLLRDVIVKSRIGYHKTITYEVNWAVPFLRLIFGGSNLKEARIGWEALDRFCNHPSERFDVSKIEEFIDGKMRENN